MMLRPAAQHIAAERRGDFCFVATWAEPGIASARVSTTAVRQLDAIDANTNTVATTTGRIAANSRHVLIAPA